MSPTETKEHPSNEPIECNQKIVLEMTEAFAKLVDANDEYTNSHSFRVAYYTKLLTAELGYDHRTIELYYYAALAHDIGKASIPKHILMKDGKLTTNEFRIISQHTTQGYEVLKGIKSAPELAQAAYCHHERPDGEGYPRGLRGDQIPRVAQIIAVADTFDAMYSDRPYRERMNFEHVVSIIREGAGTQFFVDVVDAFLRLVQKGEFRAKDDFGGGCTEDINNIEAARMRA